MTIYAASDHAGFALRRKLVAHLRRRGFQVEDLGPPSSDQTDYPDWAAKAGRAIRANVDRALGLLVCGSGVGICIAANKVRGVRAAAAWSVESARLSRAHNNANVLCLGERLLPSRRAIAILDAWLATPFDGGRHADRVRKISEIEKQELDLCAGQPGQGATSNAE